MLTTGGCVFLTALECQSEKSSAQLKLPEQTLAFPDPLGAAMLLLSGDPVHLPPYLPNLT